MEDYFDNVNVVDVAGDRNRNFRAERSIDIVETKVCIVTPRMSQQDGYANQSNVMSVYTLVLFVGNIVKHNSVVPFIPPSMKHQSIRRSFHLFRFVREAKKVIRPLLPW